MIRHLLFALLVGAFQNPSVNGPALGNANTWTAAQTFSAAIYRSVATGISAAGTNQGSCTQLTADFSNVTTVGASTGMCLPPTVAGAQFIVHTTGANTLAIYANPGGGTLNGQSATSSITIINTGGTTPGSRIITCYSSTLCYSNLSLADAN